MLNHSDNPIRTAIGEWVKKQLPDGAITRYMVGDITGDGEIDQDDIEILQHLIADDATGQFLMERMHMEELMACDVNNDGILNQADLALLCNKIITDLENLSITDELTGLMNRRGFKEKARLKIQASKRFGTPLFCLALDIDHFKSVNDRFGHDVGDQVLQITARRLEENTRCSDVVCRYGGEEFMILLEDINGEGALKHAEKIRQDVEAYTSEAQRCPCPITLSVGVAAYHPAFSYYTWIKHADMALYTAKVSGRNRICLFNRGS